MIKAHENPLPLFQIMTAFASLWRSLKSKAKTLLRYFKQS